MSAARLLPSGPHAILAEYDTINEVMAVTGRFAVTPPAGVVDVVPAARTVLITHRRDADLALVRALLTEPTGQLPTSRTEAAPVELAVTYDGIDLGAVAHACGLTADEVVAAHTAAAYTVAFCGFVPGFAYLVGLDPRLVLPRRSTPRERVTAGSVAIAAEYSAVYPTASPGGWHLLGHTDTELWRSDLGRPVLTPGTVVRFVAR